MKLYQYLYMFLLFFTAFMPSVYANDLLPAAIEKGTEVLPTPGQLAPAAEITGVVTGYGELKKDSFVDYGLIVPALKTQDIQNFALSTLLSPDDDILKLRKKEMEVPSNLVFPQQTEAYLGIKVPLEKSRYRFTPSRKGSYKLAALRGSFKLTAVIRAAKKGADFVTLFSYFKVKGGGLSNSFRVKKKRLSPQVNYLPQSSIDVTAVKAVQKDLMVNDWELKDTVTLKAIKFDNKKEQLFAISMYRDGKFFIPQDIKAPKAKKDTEIRYKAGATGRFILVTKAKSDIAGRVFKIGGDDDEESESSESIDDLNVYSQRDILSPRLKDIDDMDESIFGDDKTEWDSEDWVDLKDEDPLTETKEITLYFGPVNKDGTVTATFLPIIDEPVLNRGLEVTLFAPVLKGDLARQITPAGSRVILYEAVPTSDKIFEGFRKKIVATYNFKKWVKRTKIPALSRRKRGKVYHLEIAYFGTDKNDKGAVKEKRSNYVSRNYLRLEEI